MNRVNPEPEGIPLEEIQWALELYALLNEPSETADVTPFLAEHGEGVLLKTAMNLVQVALNQLADVVLQMPERNVDYVPPAWLDRDQERAQDATRQTKDVAEAYLNYLQDVVAMCQTNPQVGDEVFLDGLAPGLGLIEAWRTGDVDVVARVVTHHGFDRTVASLVHILRAIINTSASERGCDDEDARAHLQYLLVVHRSRLEREQPSDVDEEEVVALARELLPLVVGRASKQWMDRTGIDALVRDHGTTRVLLAMCLLTQYAEETLGRVLRALLERTGVPVPPMANWLPRSPLLEQDRTPTATELTQLHREGLWALARTGREDHDEGLRESASCLHTGLELVDACDRRDSEDFLFHVGGAGFEKSLDHVYLVFRLCADRVEEITATPAAEVFLPEQPSEESVERANGPEPEGAGMTPETIIAVAGELVPLLLGEDPRVTLGGQALEALMQRHGADVAVMAMSSLVTAADLHLGQAVVNAVLAGGGQGTCAPAWLPDETLWMSPDNPLALPTVVAHHHASLHEVVAMAEQGNDHEALDLASLAEGLETLEAWQAGHVHRYREGLEARGPFTTILNLYVVLRLTVNRILELTGESPQKLRDDLQQQYTSAPLT
ncbi:hypothetical protein ACFFHC_07415 [Kytococcus schroeteri]|uniref:hypothetical protein n=1 Tax=Kytococcus schroeteri TaxID=138300 RepID=UPI0035EA9D22